MLAEQIGLNFPADRWRDMEHGITAAARAFGLPDARSCAHRLLSAPLRHREIEILASYLTIGETYFFRDPRSFEALEQHILPPLLRAREQGGRRLRIWSAGCCTGEEPYSIAMVLDRLMPNVDAWNATILATDINPAFLRKAAEAAYGKWSFRSTPEWIREGFFQPLRGDRYRLEERIRKRVNFSCLNLADDTYPALTSNTNAMDVIFCRNVLMYFTAERARMVVDNLHRALVDGGWLIVSPAEASNVLFSDFFTVQYNGVTLYRKDSRAKARHCVSHDLHSRVESLPEPWRLPGQALPMQESSPGPMSAPIPLAEPSKIDSPTPADQASPSRAARDCANRGQLGEAAEWCRQAITADKLNPAHHYLLAAIQQEQGQADNAAQSLACTLYLDPEFVLAHYALGNLRQSQGRRREALRHFDNAVAALQAHPPDELLPEADGLTVGRLAEIIESMRSSMPIPASGI
jgi:chemotaxis protein methyltransferase CheR